MHRWIGIDGKVYNGKGLGKLEHNMQRWIEINWKRINEKGKGEGNTQGWLEINGKVIDKQVEGNMQEG